MKLVGRVATVPAVIRAAGLTKRYGSVLAVDSLDLDVQPGRVTGFLGPNGSGKSTTMRCLVGLDRPSAGWATINGRPFAELHHPLREVGVLLDAGYVHPGRRAVDHLRAMAAANGLPRGRVDEVLATVGLSDVARVRVGGFSLGMRQRLGIAGVLLGDPATVILDEPANGLDPEGIRWIRDFLSYLATEGRTVFVSSHQLSEMALIADHVVVIGRGRLIEECSVADFLARHADRAVRVRSPRLGQLIELIRRRGGEIAPVDGDAVLVRQMDAAVVGELAAAAQIVLHELSPQSGSLEEAYLRVTTGEEAFRATRTPALAPGPAVGPPTLPTPAPPAAGTPWAPPARPEP